MSFDILNCSAASMKAPPVRKGNEHLRAGIDDHAKAPQ